MLRTLSLCLLLSPAAWAQTATPAPAPDCTAAEYRQFDFWLGDWDVTAQDKPAGFNRIETGLDGCVLREHWQGAGGLAGSSLNFYDRSDQHWHQLWVDARGNVLRLRGRLLEPGVMQLDSLPGAAGQAQRITWRRQADGSVEQHWQQQDAEGAWQTAFLGLYRRAAAAP